MSALAWASVTVAGVRVEDVGGVLHARCPACLRVVPAYIDRRQSELLPYQHWLWNEGRKATRYCDGDMQEVVALSADDVSVLDALVRPDVAGEPPPDPRPAPPPVAAMPPGGIQLRLFES